MSIVIFRYLLDFQRQIIFKFAAMIENLVTGPVDCAFPHCFSAPQSLMCV